MPTSPYVIAISKADPVVSGENIRGVVISVDRDLRQFNSLDDAREFYENEAAMLENALYSSLPQATYDKLLAKMFQRRASLFRGKGGN